MESPLESSVGMINDLMPSGASAPAARQQPSHAPHPSLNPLQFAKNLLGGGGEEAGAGAAAGAGEAAAGAGALEELAPLALLAL